MLSLLVLSLGACSPKSLFGPHITEAPGVLIQAEVPADRTFGSASVTVPALTAVPIHFQTNGVKHFEMVLVVNGFVEFTAGPGLEGHSSMDAVSRHATYVTFDRLTPEDELVLIATNPTNIDGADVSIGYSETNGYIATSIQQSGAVRRGGPHPDFSVESDHWWCHMTSVNGSQQTKCGYGPDLSPTKP